MLRTVTAYLSHPIRGAKGASATPEDMANNNFRAHNQAVLLRHYLGNNIEIYVPAENDEIITDLYVGGALTDTAIINADIKILKRRDLLLVFQPDPKPSRGMQSEIDSAKKADIPIIRFKEIDKSTLALLEGVISSVQEGREILRNYERSCFYE
jgi:hypothetical protein